jgi:hypothetical protein
MAEKRVIELEIQDNVKSLKTQYREAVQEVQRLADTYGATSREAAEAAKRAAELKDRIEESKSLTDAFNPDAKFNALSSSIGGVLNGFQAYEGAMGLIGVESEQLQETLLKVQSAMALSQGIQGALEAKDAFMNLGAVVKNAFASMTTASKVFLAGGIGLVITGVALAVNEFNKYNEQLKESQKQQKLLADIEKEAIKNISAEASAADKLQKQLKDENLSRSEKTAKVKEFQKEYPNLLSNIDAEKSSINEINTALTQNIELLKLQSKAKAIQSKRAEIYAQQLEIELGKEKAANEAKKEGGILDNLFGTAVSGASTAAITETETRLSKQLKIVDEFDASIQKQIDALQKRGAVVKQEGDKENKTAQEIANYTRQLEKERIDAMEDGMEKRIKLLQFEQKEEISKIDKNGKKAGELRKAITDRYEKEIEKVRYEFRDRSDRDDQINLEKKVATRISTGKLELEAEEAIRTEIYQMNLEQDEKDKARIKQLNEYRVQAVKDGLQTISNLAELFAGKSEKQQKRAFQIQKAVNIANAVIDTYKAANTALASSPPPFNYIAMAAAITAGLVNVKKIASQQFQSSSSSSGGGGGTPSAPEVAQVAPQFNTIGSSGINQLAQLQMQPVQAYVVSGQVTSAQALDRNRIQNSSL